MVVWSPRQQINLIKGPSQPGQRCPAFGRKKVAIVSIMTSLLALKQVTKGYRTARERIGEATKMGSIQSCDRVQVRSRPQIYA